MKAIIITVLAPHLNGPAQCPPLANQCCSLRAVQLFAPTVERAAQDRLVGTGEGDAGIPGSPGPLGCSVPLLLAAASPCSAGKSHATRVHAQERRNGLKMITPHGRASFEAHEAPGQVGQHKSC